MGCYVMTDGEKKAAMTAIDVATLFAYETFMADLISGRFVDVEEAMREASLLDLKLTTMREKAND